MIQAIETSVVYHRGFLTSLDSKVNSQQLKAKMDFPQNYRPVFIVIDGEANIILFVNLDSQVMR